MHEKSQLNTEQSSRLQKKTEKEKKWSQIVKRGENKDIRAALICASFEKVFAKVSSSKNDNLPYFWIIKTSQRKKTSCAIFSPNFCCVNCEFTEWVKLQMSGVGKNVKPGDSSAMEFVRLQWCGIYELKRLTSVLRQWLLLKLLGKV